MTFTPNWTTDGTDFGTQVTTITLAAGANVINAGDLLIAFFVATNFGTTDPGAMTPPSGWAQIDDAAVTDGVGPFAIRTEVWYKVAGGSETGNYVFSWTNPAYVRWMLGNISGENQSSPVDVTAAATTGGSQANDVCPSVTPNFTNDFLLAFWTATGSGNPYTPDASMTSWFNANSTAVGHPQLAVSYLQLSSGSPTGAKNMSQTGGNFFAGQRGVMVALAAPGGGAAVVLPKPPITLFALPFAPI